MNITLSIAEEIVMQAREAAAAMGKSLNDVIREDLERLIRREQRKQGFTEMKTLSGQGNAKGWRFDRDELYARGDLYAQG
ncbi:MAG: hypothetical protein LBF16_05375 [Pseudomonadales bacterium]|jgi:hypothetical protein|nr:hypothetical protein [Pseudomonadales bacterium]